MSFLLACALVDAQTDNVHAAGCPQCISALVMMAIQLAVLVYVKVNSIDNFTIIIKMLF